MSANTPNYAFPYPTLTDAPNGAAQMQSLATAIDTQLKVTDNNAATNTANISRSTAGPVAAKMYQSGAQSGIASSTWTRVNLNAVDLDPSSICNTSLFRITPGVVGYYQVSGRVSYAAGTPGSRFAALYKNGAQVPRVAGGVTSAVGAGSGGSFSQVIQITNVADYLELWTYQDSGVSFSTYVDTINASQLMVEFIRVS